MASLSECKNELRSIIQELQSIEDGVRSDFTGVGQDLCADCIERVIMRYKVVQRQLNNVNTNRLAEWVYGD